MPKQNTTNVFDQITETIVDAIERGAESYRMPWKTSGEYPMSPINTASRKPYRGVNTLLLWAAAEAKGYESGTWGTYKQWQERGGQVRKGEKSTCIVFWKFFKAESEDDDDAAGDTSRTVPMARRYCVFNAAQVDGIEAEATEPKPEAERIAHADEFFNAVGVRVQPGGNRAFYRPSTDSVHMPRFDAFTEPLAYYSVLSHETTHWTAAPSRLDRDMSGRFGSETYAMEELVAELGAAFLCSTLGLPTDPRTDHAPYVASWLKVLKNDKRAIFTAAGKAQQAADWLASRHSERVMVKAA